MANSKPTTQARNGLTNFCFYFLLFSYPVLSFLWRRSYPVFTTEVFLIFLVVIGMSIVFGLVTARLRPLISYLLMGFLILVTALVQFNLFFEGLAIGIGLMALVIFILKQRFLSFCLPVLVALIIGAYLDSNREPLTEEFSDNAITVNIELAPVVHILLDGFIGIGGLPPYPASDLIRQEILSFFEKNDFQLYTSAYSRYDVTGDSMYSAMNYLHDGLSLFKLEQAARQKSVLKNNAVFSTLEEMGYRLNVYQTGHLDLCQSNPESLDRCWQYDHPNLRSVLTSNEPSFKFRVLGSVLIKQSTLLSGLLLTGDRTFGNLAIANHDPQLFKELKQDIHAKGQGNYFFAHALLPHGPYAYQPDCSVSYEFPFFVRMATEPQRLKWPERIFETRHGLYYGQIECALRSLQSLFDSMSDSGLYDRAVIILHGDHGSHIKRQDAVVKNLDTYTNQDYRTSYSTLFAVKYPDSTFSIDERVLPLSYLLEEFMAALPLYATRANSHVSFSPSDDADPEKIDSYVYFRGTYPMQRVDVDFFKD